jgi:hypothetical protein
MQIFFANNLLSFGRASTVRYGCFSSAVSRKQQDLESGDRGVPRLKQRVDHRLRFRGRGSKWTE